MPPERKQHGMSVSQRQALRNYARQNPLLTQSQLRQWFEAEFQRLITQPTISESLSSKFAHLDSPGTNLPSGRQRTRAVQHPELEQALFEWQQRIEKNIPLSGEAIREQAKRFWSRLPQYREMEIPIFSNRWLQGYKQRYNIRQRVRYREAASVDEAFIAEQMVATRTIVQQFRLQDVYNCGLFWKATPDRGLSTQQLSGTKSHKARITAYFCCNADRTHKLPPWFIGKSATPL